MKKKSYVRYMLNTMPLEFGNQSFFYVYRTKRAVKLIKEIQNHKRKWRRVRITIEEIANEPR